MRRRARVFFFILPSVNKGKKRRKGTLSGVFALVNRWYRPQSMKKSQGRQAAL